MAHRRGARTDPESRHTACAGFQPGSPGARPRLSCCTGHGAGRSRESSFEAALMGTVSSLGELTPSLAPPDSSSSSKGFLSMGQKSSPPGIPTSFSQKICRPTSLFHLPVVRQLCAAYPPPHRAYLSLSTWPLEDAVCGRGAGALTSSVHQMA